MKYKILLVLLLAMVAVSQIPKGKDGMMPIDDFPSIRHTDGTRYTEVLVRKFEDGPNTCYVSISRDGTGGTNSSISCVVRGK